MKFSVASVRVPCANSCNHFRAALKQLFPELYGIAVTLLQNNFLLWGKNES